LLRHRLMKIRISTLLFLLTLSIGTANAQRAEVTLTLNEHFFDTVIGSLLESGPPPEFSIGAFNGSSAAPEFINAGYASPRSDACPDTIRLQRQVEGVNTAVRFREGKIWAPLAFTGNYNP